MIPHWHATLRTAGLAALVCAALASAPACTSTTSFQLSCDPVVNDGLLLTVDLIQVNEDEALQIRQAGDNWFYSDLRRQLSLRTRTVAVEGSCRTKVTLTHHKKHDILAVVADYQFPASDRTQTHMQFKSKNEWRGKKLELQIHNTYLNVVLAR
jgi:hypothetical protein